MMLFTKFVVAVCHVGSLPSQVLAVDSSEMYSINPSLSQVSNGSDFIFAYLDPKANKVVQGETQDMQEKVRRGGIVREPSIKCNH
jgi:hypothetical protein